MKPRFYQMGAFGPYGGGVALTRYPVEGGLRRYEDGLREKWPGPHGMHDSLWRRTPVPVREPEPRILERAERLRR